MVKKLINAPQPIPGRVKGPCMQASSDLYKTFSRDGGFWDEFRGAC